MVFCCISSHDLAIAVLVLANVVDVHNSWLALLLCCLAGEMEAHHGHCHQHCFEREAPFFSENKANVDVGKCCKGLSWGDVDAARVSMERAFAGCVVVSKVPCTVG